MDDLRYLIALTGIKGIGSIYARHLIEAFGSAQAVLEADARLLVNVPRVGQALIAGRGDPKLLERADAELAFISQHHIRAWAYGQPGYPHRLLECPDAPAVIYSLGEANLESGHVVGIVGTRTATQYGRDMVTRLVEGLHEALPDLVVVSGLAIGIDVAAHRASLRCGVPTVGVVAHGLDRVYPYVHRPTAREMVQSGGGLLTEYPTHTTPERGNFLARNRIIAGLCDAVVVGESKDKGGSLVTASIALDYDRDVFAFPGRAGDERSQGCNRLIRLNRAGLITCADDLIEAMRWQSAAPKAPAQQVIDFGADALPATLAALLTALRDRGDLRLAQLAEVTGFDTPTLTEALLDLEMDGRIRKTPGGLYQLR